MDPFWNRRIHGAFGLAIATGCGIRWTAVWFPSFLRRNLCRAGLTIPPLLLKSRHHSLIEGSALTLFDGFRLHDAQELIQREDPEVLRKEQADVHRQHSCQITLALQKRVGCILFLLAKEDFFDNTGARLGLLGGSL